MGIPPVVAATVVSDRTPHGTFRTPTADGVAGVALGGEVGRAEGAPAVGPGDGGATGTAREGEGVAAGATVAAGADASGVRAADAPLGAGVAAVATDPVGVGEREVSVETSPLVPAQAAKTSPSKPGSAALPTRAGVYFDVDLQICRRGQEPRGGPLTR